jgi:hypothetical protein
MLGTSDCSTTTGESSSTATDKGHPTLASIAMKNLLNPQTPRLFTPLEEACLFFLSKRMPIGKKTFEHFKEYYPSSVRTCTQVARAACRLSLKTGEEANALTTLASQQSWWKEWNFGPLSKSPATPRASRSPSVSEKSKELSPKQERRKTRVAEARARYHGSPVYQMKLEEKREKKKQMLLERRIRKWRARSIASSVGLSSPLANFQISSSFPEMKIKEEEEAETRVGLDKDERHISL